MARELDAFELALLETEVGDEAQATVAGTAAVVPSGASVTQSGDNRTYRYIMTQNVLGETAFRAQFIANELPLLLANIGTWYLVAERDQGFLRKEEQLKGIPKTLFTTAEQSLQTRTLIAGTASNGRRIGNLYCRIF